MKVLAAYLLALLGGNTCPSAHDLKNILGSVGAEADEERIELLLSQVKGKDITELIAAGRERLAAVLSGGGGGVETVYIPPPFPESPKKENKVEEDSGSDSVSCFFLCCS
ncbi:large ribosomal subunit protein P2-like [Bidens hawaiensis]|uniref:large ribosomal subunit protein P2-like n=1 Tax=Bidens hawaiensis TaxID=980011 RepID=UPI00404B78E5